MTAASFFFGGMSLVLLLSADACYREARRQILATSDLGRSWRRQILATWLNSSSTGVSRPKIDTSTLRRWASRFTSLIVAGRVANGPSVTVTDSPTEYSCALGASTRFFSTAGARIDATSSIRSGDGRLVRPTKPVTLGVLRTADHDSSVRSIRM